MPRPALKMVSQTALTSCMGGAHWRIGDVGWEAFSLTPPRRPQIWQGKPIIPGTKKGAYQEAGD